MKMMKKMKDKQIAGEKSGSFKEELSAFFKRNVANIILFICAFFAFAAILYFRTATTETVASFKLNDFEIGQISDRTIIAEKYNVPVNTVILFEMLAFYNGKNELMGLTVGCYGDSESILTVKLQ